jgi:tetratricopeptide (TPR) repeat protein
VHAQSEGELALPSGRKVHYKSIGPVLYKHLGTKDKAILLTLSSDYSLDDRDNVAKEISEVWAALQIRADEGAYKQAIISDEKIEDIAGIQAGKAENFIFIKDDSGHWTCENDPSIAQAGQMYTDLLPLLKNNQHEQAIKVLSELIRLWPDSYQCYFNRGACYIRTNSLDAALADLNKSIELFPDSAMTYNNRGMVDRKLGKQKEAFADWDKAISLDPKLDAPYMNRGALNVRLSKYEKALPDLNKAIEINPDLGEAYWWRASAYKKLHRKQESAADFESADKLGYHEGTDTWNVKLNK